MLCIIILWAQILIIFSHSHSRPLTTLMDLCVTFRHSRLDRINMLGQRINSKKRPAFISPPSQLETKIQISINQFMVKMLWFDKELAKCINLFPSQLLELEKVLPHKNLRPTLKMLNTIISSSDKEIKNDDNGWTQLAIYFLQEADKYWSLRWHIPEYNHVTQGKDPMAISHIIDNALQHYGIEKEGGQGRGIVLRYLMDIEQ